MSIYWGDNSNPYVEMMPTEEQKYRDSLQIGEYVRNIGKNSKYFGMIGRIVDKDYAVYVKYEGIVALGRHPAKILIKSEYDHFTDDLFIMK